MTYGEKITFVRTQVLHMSQSEFSKLLDCSQGFISDIERGRAKVSAQPTLYFFVSTDSTVVSSQPCVHQGRFPQVYLCHLSRMCRFSLVQSHD